MTITVTEGVRVKGWRFVGGETIEASVLEGRVETTWVKVWAVLLVCERGWVEVVVSLICVGV